MIVVDTSALFAVLANEPERERFTDIIAAADGCSISALILYETRLVTLSRFGDAGLDRLARLIDEFDVSIVPFDRPEADLAIETYRRYGKLHSPARLNLCDCAAYALAKSLGAPLLFKGADFSMTDIVSADLVQ